MLGLAATGSVMAAWYPAMIRSQTLRDLAEGLAAVADHRVRVKGYTHHTSFGSGAWPGRRIFVQPNFRRLWPQYEGLNSGKNRSSDRVNPARRERLMERYRISVQLSDCGLWVAVFVDWISERASARSDRRPHRVAMLSERSLQASQLIFRRPGVLCS